MRIGMIDRQAIRKRWESVGSKLDERGRRVFAAGEARAAGWKKELPGNSKNGGADYRSKGEPRLVNVHDFEDKTLGKVVPYGVYDVTSNAGFVSTVCSATSRRTGAAGRSRIVSPWSRSE